MSPPSIADTSVGERVAEFAARDRFGRLVGALARRFGPHADAENALADALSTALARWPRDGVPENPGGWLLTVAGRRLVDAARHDAVAARASEQLAVLRATLEGDVDAERGVPDERLKLMLVCTHPAIDRAAQVPLMLQSVLGLTAEQIAAAFLVSPNAMGQRLARAKNKIRKSGIAFETPPADLLRERLDALLDAIYVCCTRGFSATASPESSEGLATEALWLASIVHALQPADAEVKGLLALLLLLEARRANRDPDGDVRWAPLTDRDPALWDEGKIERAESLLREACRAGSPGRFQIEAAIQSAHCDRRRTGRTPWEAILSLYDALLRVAPSTGARVARAAVLIGQEALHRADEALGEIEADGSAVSYQPYWTTLAELRARQGRREEARRCFSVAIGLTANPAIREYLLRRRGRPSERIRRPP